MRETLAYCGESCDLAAASKVVGDAEIVIICKALKVSIGFGDDTGSCYLDGG